MPIRSSKYSYRIVTQTKSFALNIPARDMRNEISVCDSMSGFKYNKFEALGLHPKKAKSIEAYVLGECSLIAECRVVAVIPPESVTHYADDLFQSPRAHTLFAGEIIERYKLN